MSTENPIAHACRLLRETAMELQQAHTRGDRDDWTGEPEAKAAFDEYMAVAGALGALASAAVPAEQPLPLLVRDIAAELGCTPIQVCNALAEMGIGNYSVNMAVTPTMAKSLRKHFEAAPQPDTAYAALPVEWVPLTITHEGQHPEEVAYGPKVMMDRLGKWLGKHFEQLASRGQAPAQQGVQRLSEQDAGLLEQAASLLEDVEGDERNRGNCSTAEGAACSAHAVRRLASALLAADRAAKSAPTAPSVLEDAALSQAARDVLAERQRQISTEGWTPEHDDEHSQGEMAEAAACYAASAHVPAILKRRQAPGFWPWAAKWWKPSDTRRDLIKAGALILAELERIDRAAMAAKKGG